MIAFEDDASRTILSISQVNSHMHATADNAIAALQRAEAVATAHRSHIREVNTDQGSQFYASGGEKRAKVSADLNGI